MRKMLGFLSVILMSQTLYASPQCPEFDIAGKWKNKMGQRFVIAQDGCNTVRLFDLDSNNRAGLRSSVIDWRFDLNGSSTGLSQSYINFISTTESDLFREDLGLASNKDVINGAKISSVLHSGSAYKMVRLKLEADPFSFMGRLLGSGYMAVKLQLEINAYVMGPAKTVRSPINTLNLKIESLNVQAIEQAFLDPSSFERLSSAVIQLFQVSVRSGANAILNSKFVLDALSDQLIRE